MNVDETVKDEHGERERLGGRARYAECQGLQLTMPSNAQICQDTKGSTEEIPGYQRGNDAAIRAEPVLGTTVRARRRRTHAVRWCPSFQLWRTLVYSRRGDLCTYRSPHLLS